MLDRKRQLYKAHKRVFVLHSILWLIFCLCDAKNRVHKQVYVTPWFHQYVFVSNQNLNVVKLSLSSLGMRRCNFFCFFTNADFITCRRRHVCEVLQAQKIEWKLHSWTLAPTPTDLQVGAASINEKAKRLQQSNSGTTSFLYINYCLKQWSKIILKRLIPC